MRCPSSDSTAGSSVRAASTLTATTSEPARPSERSALMSNVSSASMPMQTVTPLKSTARPAVATDQATASSTERPRGEASSSRNRLTMNSE